MRGVVDAAWESLGFVNERKTRRRSPVHVYRHLVVLSDIRAKELLASLCRSDGDQSCLSGLIYRTADQPSASFVHRDVKSG